MPGELTAISGFGDYPAEKTGPVVVTVLAPVQVAQVHGRRSPVAEPEQVVDQGSHGVSSTGQMNTRASASRLLYDVFQD